MKFSLFTQAALAMPFLTGALAAPAADSSEAKRADCSLEIRYISNWVEAGLDRYRMQLITNPRNDRHLDVYCNRFTSTIGLTHNKQCFWGDAFYADGSAARGPAGRQAIMDAHNYVSNDFELLTGCRTIRNF
ncbi:hypothetical protein ACHAPU_002681 [Fusarium lateritium]